MTFVAGRLGLATSLQHHQRSNVLEMDANIGRSVAPLGRRVPVQVLRSSAFSINSAAAEPAELTTPRPPCYKEVWQAPSPSRLIRDKRAFTEEHRIRGFEVGPDQRTSIISIANLLQEVAGNHAVAMWGRSNEGFAADPEALGLGLIFVMTRMQIQVEHYPRWGDLVEFETWFQEAGKLAAQRDWLIREKSTGRLLGRATSTWVMINMNTRRLCKMPPKVHQRCSWYQLQPKADAIPPACTRLKIPELNPAAATQGASQVARRADMDMNGHINNVIYLAWAIETVPSDVHDDSRLYQIEVDFKAECLCGDEIETMVQAVATPEVVAANGAGPEALTYVHSLLRREEGDKATELVRARSVWRRGALSSSDDTPVDE